MVPEFGKDCVWPPSGPVPVVPLACVGFVPGFQVVDPDSVVLLLPAGGVAGGSGCGAGVAWLGAEQFISMV